MVVDVVAPRPVPRLSSPSVAAFRDFVRTDSPALIRDVASGWPAVTKWTLAYIREHAGEALVDLRPKRDYGAGGSQRMHETVEVKLATLIDRIEAGAQDELCYAKQFALLEHPRFAADVLPLPYFDERGASQGWLGPAGTVTHLHWDPAHNLLVQIRGRKRVVLAAPMDAPRLSPNQFTLGWIIGQLDDHRLATDLAAVERMGGDLRTAFATRLDANQRLFLFNVLAGLNSHDIDIEDPSAVRHVQRWEATLEPGDMLFMPFMWRHQVRSLDKSISLNWFYSPSDRSGDEIRETVLETLAQHLTVA
jgi:cupin-like protein